MKIAGELKAKPFYSKGHLFLGEIYTQGGKTEEAMENLKKAETMFQEMDMAYWLSKTQDALEKL
jgi:tetratricopeptide (TPR) repeat protein